MSQRLVLPLAAATLFVCPAWAELPRPAPGPGPALERNELHALPHVAAKGAAQAPIELVAFIDYECGFCKKAAATVRALEREYGERLRVSVVHRPLPFHPQAASAARAVLAAEKAGRGFELHEALLAEPKLDPAVVRRTAARLGLDLNAIEAALTGEHQSELEAHQALASKLEVKGTPTFFINGARLTGAQPLAAFKERIDAALAGRPVQGDAPPPEGGCGCPRGQEGC